MENKLLVKFTILTDNIGESLLEIIKPILVTYTNEITHYNFKCNENGISFIVEINEASYVSLTDSFMGLCKEHLSTDYAEKCDYLTITNPLIPYKNTTELIEICNSIKQLISKGVISFYEENNNIQYNHRMGYALQLIFDTYKATGVSFEELIVWIKSLFNEVRNIYFLNIQVDSKRDNLETFIMEKMQKQYEKEKSTLHALLKKIWENTDLTDFQKDIHQTFERLYFNLETKKIDIEYFTQESSHEYYSIHTKNFFVQQTLLLIGNKLSLYGADQLYLLYITKESIQELFSITTKSSK